MNRGVDDDGSYPGWIMKKQNIIPLALFLILFAVFMAAPVSGGLVIAEEGATITSETGATSPVIQITDPPIASGGTITIDVESMLRYYFASGSIADTNIEVSTTASGVTWTPAITTDIFGAQTLTLTSSGGNTLVDDNITLTFKGTTTEPWMAGLGYSTFSVTVTRIDTTEPVDLTFITDIPAVSGGLSATDGVTVTTTTGSTSPVITVLNSPIAEGSNITIDIDPLGMLFTGNTVTDANVEVTSSAALPVVWTRSVSPDGKNLTLTSTGGATDAGKTVTVTFTGTAGNPWVYDTTFVTLVPTRDDTAGTAVFNVLIDVPLPGDLTAAHGDKITTTTGATSPVITITNAPIAQDGTITINTAALNPYVDGGHLMNANVMVTDTAAAATWTRSVSGNILTLTSTGGGTAEGENVTVTFTGAAGTAWTDDTGAERTIPLTAIRGDTLETAGFDFVIDIGGRPVANFSASSLSATAPATITFTDQSSRSPFAWNWSFGDGTYSELQNPLPHYYATSGLYTVSLNATNARGSNTVTKGDYIDVYREAFGQANTVINGLTIINCGGPQSITVNTAVLPADLILDKYVLEIQPPADRGLKNITIYAQNGVGFTRNGNLITGSPTAVHLVSEDIAPSSGFSPEIGTKAAFNWSADLSSYPCNATISTNIREGVTSENNAKLLQIASGQDPPAVPKGTAYTATITKTNFPLSVPAKLHMSINPDWRTLTLLDPTSRIFIWRIADNGASGQILPTDLLSTDPVKNLDYFAADSPRGMSTFGLSAFTGNNNPVQLITFAIASYIGPQNPAGPVAPEINEAEQPVKPSVTSTPNPTATPLPNATTTLPALPEGITAKLYTNADGVTTQASTLTSADGSVTVSVSPGIVAKDQNGKPLTSITLTPVAAGNLPGTLPGGAFMFAGKACELQPDGAVFSPGISLIFTVPRDARIGQDFSIQFYDRATGTWQGVPTRYDPGTGTITGQVSRFCTFALFARTITAIPSAAVANTPLPPEEMQAVSVPPTAMSIAAGAVRWVVHLFAENMIIATVVIILVAVFLLYEWKRRRDPWK
jgi:PKD repeat protein